MKNEFQIEKIRDRFQRKDMAEYRAIPLWSWNGRLEKEKLQKQMHWMRENGIGGFFMHARSGLETEYMSEEWMECIRFCAEEAEKIGMDAWIYDENGWPSGFAGGKLLEKEENRDMYILAETGDFDADAAVSYGLDGPRLVRMEKKGSDSEYLNLYLRTSVSTADILNPDVTDGFLRLTHERYREKFGEGFSEKIRGFFTDEPQYYRWNTPYTRMLPEYWRKEYGGDILDGLGLLFVEKEGYREFRYRYWKAMQTLMLENFAARLYGWCERNGVRLTGHFVEESSLGGQLMCCGGIMPFYEYEHIPGIDWLGRKSENELAARQVSSAAAQLGKKQVMTETFGCCGWDITPRELRRIAGFQYVNGVNLMCQHLIPYTEYGTRKHDYPAHYSPVNPWVAEEFGAFNDYFTRLGCLLAEGKETVNIAVLHPIRSACFDYKRGLEEEGFGVGELDGRLRQVCRMLSRENAAYHFLDETLLSKYGFVRDGKIGCGKCSYEYLILPFLLTMDKTTERLVREYVRQGGKVLVLGEKPEYLEGSRHNYDYLESSCTWEEILAAQPYRVKNAETEIYSTLRTLDGTSFLYVVNASREKTYRQTFVMGEGIHSFQQLHLDSMEAERVPLTVTLEPGEDGLFFPDGQKVEPEEPRIIHSLVFQNAEVSFEENYLPLDFVRYSSDGENYSEEWPVVALFEKFLEERREGRVFLKYEFEVRQKPEKILLRTEENRPLYAAVNGTLLTEAKQWEGEKGVLSYDISPYIRIGKNEYTVQVLWHESDAVYYALFGENVTECMKNCIVYDSELEPVYLAGGFGVYPAEGYKEDEDAGYVRADRFYIGKAPDAVSDPVTDGLPFIRGPVMMRQMIHLEDGNALLRVEGSWQSAQVRINGKSAGTLLFEREMDISGYAVPGDNLVEVRFLVSNRNLLGPQHFNGGRDRGISPWTFELDGTWKEGKSEFYHEDYDLKKLYAKGSDNIIKEREP